MTPAIKQRWTPFRECDVDVELDGCDRCWRNQTHTVLVYYRNPNFHPRKEDGWVYLSIKRNDKQAECDWRIFQRIKNEIVGDEREAVQVFPAMGRVVDTCNQYHLWVAPESCIVGIGWTDGEVFDKADNGGCQRAFTVDDPLRDLIHEPRYRENTRLFTLPMYATALYKYLTSDEYRNLSFDEQERFLAGVLPNPQTQMLGEPAKTLQEAHQGGGVDQPDGQQEAQEGYQEAETPAQVKKHQKTTL